MTREEIAELQRLEKQGTSGPWAAYVDPIDSRQPPERQHGTWVVHEDLEDDPPILETRHIDQEYNARLIAEAKNYLPELLRLADRWLRLEALLETAPPRWETYWKVPDVVKEVLKAEREDADR